MIAPLGFVVLADYVDEIYSETFSIFEDDNGTENYLPSFPRQEFVEATLLSALLDVKEFWLYSAEGLMHKVSRKVHSPMFGMDEKGRKRTTFCLFNVSDMKIDLKKMSNAAKPLADPARTDRFLDDRILVKLRKYHHELAINFESLNGYFLTVAEGTLAPVSRIDTVIAARNGETEQTFKQSVSYIEALLREAAASGTLPRRDDFRRQHAPDMKIDAFKAVWRSVATEYPELSRPGPKPSGNSKS